MMHHMPLHTQTLTNSAHTLGGMLDSLISDDLDSQEIQAISDISSVITASLDSARISQISYLLTSTPSGYLATKIIDTNTDPSNLKTLGSLFAGALVSGGLSRLVGALTGSSEKAPKITAAVILNAEEAITILRSRNKISSEDADAGINALRAAAKSYKIVRNVVAAILSLESLACAYHGYRRNDDSVLYGLGWLLTNGVGIGVALGQGYAQPLGK